MDSPLRRTRIAYLVSEFPTVSHTFVLREIEALRAVGLEIETCSIRKTPSAQHRGQAERAAAIATFNVIEAAKTGLVPAKIAALRRPGRLFRAYAHAMALTGPGLRALLYQNIYFAEALVLARHLRARGIGHLHVHFANAAAMVGMLAVELAGIPWSFTLHGPSDLREPRRNRLDAKIAAARFVVCISHYARSQAMLNSDPADWPKLRIVHCGVDPDRYRDAPPPSSTPPDFVFVGRLAPVKGLRVLVEAFASVREAVPEATLTVVGDGPERAWLEAAARPFGDAVRLTGALSQDEVAGVLAGARALVLPSFAEGVPVVLMEAMASGRPVIATRITGVPELVDDGVSGLLVAPGDTEALARAMLKIAVDPALCAHMGEAGRTKVESEFDISSEAARMATLLRGRGSGIRPEATA